MSPYQALVLGFACVILIGGILLSLPISSIDGQGTKFLDSLFTATSAVCVTGLVVFDTATHWSFLGQIIIIFLIQIGGLGFMTIATMFALIIGKKITLKERLLMQEALNQFDLQGLVRLTKNIIIATFMIELIGAIFFSIVFIPEFGFKKGVFVSVFHSISAFCNAGFDLIGDYRSLTPYVQNDIVLINTMFLIIVGGLGFSVWMDIYNNKNFSKFTLHTKTVLVMTSFLIIIGAVMIFLFEFNNPNTILNLPIKSKILASLFHSVTPRTAGFNALDNVSLTEPSKFITILLMFIGGSPGSTAGGIKTTTAGILILTMLSVIVGREDTEVFEKRIPKFLVYRALAVTMVSCALVIISTTVLLITENADFITVLFEAISAFGTVGLSLNFTPNVSDIGRIVLIITMFSGRVGPLTLVFAFSQRAQKHKSNLKYPEDRINVG